MSTRCQVKVINEGIGWTENVTLYHHTDGYPEYMIPLITKAYKDDWQHGRAGKVASFLCAIDPGIFEPEEGHGLHQDIEYYYKLYIKSESHIGAVPTWEVEIYTFKYYDKCWKDPMITRMELFMPRTDIMELKDKYPDKW